MLPVFFKNQKIVIQLDIRMRNNEYITISPRSGLQKPENIENLLKAGAVGRVDDFDGGTVTITFFPGSSDEITIVTKKFTFANIFSATDQVYNER
ncbi:MAG: hypothetical protein OEL76_03980 [Siculibacillus sp.]|nr:hypothetical protein [Siculibacillus sp.]